MRLSLFCANFGFCRTTCSAAQDVVRSLQHIKRCQVGRFEPWLLPPMPNVAKRCREKRMLLLITVLGCV